MFVHPVGQVAADRTSVHLSDVRLREGSANIRTRMEPRVTSRRESGQAAVEAALTIPFAVFLVLGTLQLFLMLQGRILAEYAVFKATRAGAVNGADCEVMTHAAIASLLPSITRTDDPQHLVKAFLARRFNRYVPGNGNNLDGSLFGPIVWIEKRLDRDVGNNHQETFDDRSRNQPGARAEIMVDMVFWFPLRIPFADWVMARMFLAFFGGMPYTEFNPLMPAQKQAMWLSDNASKDTLTSKIRNELQMRVMLGQYVAPIRTSFRMRQMTPAVFLDKKCPNSPDSFL